jgi:uncharacterized Zn-finger protein
MTSIRDLLDGKGDPQLVAEIDHKYTDEAVCPYCGGAQSDSWELEGGDGEEGETDCGYCDRAFLYYRNISVTYSTLPVEEQP